MRVRAADRRAAERVTAREGVRRHRPGDGQATLPRRGRPGRADGRRAGGEGADAAPQPRSTSGATRGRRRRSTSCSTGSSRSSTLEPSTRSAYRGYVDKHVRPVLGQLQVGALDARVARLVLRRAAPLPRPLRRRGGRRAPRARGEHACDDALPPARLPAVGAVDGAADPLDPRGAFKPRRPVALGRDQPDRAGRAAARRRSRTRSRRSAEEAARDRQRGMAGPGLGHAGLARDDHRRPAGRAVRAALARSSTSAASVLSSGRASAGRAAAWEKDTKTHQQRRIASTRRRWRAARATTRGAWTRRRQLGVELAA